MVCPGISSIFRYGMPYRVRTDGKIAITKTLASAAQDIRKDHLYYRLGLLGLFCIVLGTCLQIGATLASN